ncbi:MAG: FHA domain-containing protein [Proteobacteria bacterium]|nr:FHA domain-containing protein [Pseudomonadota bacterium]
MLGRRSVDLVVKDSEASRRHAVLEVFGVNEVFVRDLDSTNGTMLNGRRVTTARVRDFDQLQIGSKLFILRLSRPAA